MPNSGKQLEKDWKDSCEQDGVYFERHRDSSNSWGGGQAKFTAKNPYDSYMYKYPNLICVELKSTKGTSFSFNEKIIKKHQINSLLRASEHEGVIAGFIFNFRERETKKGIKPNTVYFVTIDSFVDFQNTSGKQSINEEDCKALGASISCKIKMVHYKYDINKFFIDCSMGNNKGIT